MHNFCTLFDSKYLERGLILYESLGRHTHQPFMLHVLAMDQETEKILSVMAPRYMRVIPLEAVEYHAKLGEIKKGRTWQEYCWTCASQLLQYLIGYVGDITYLDADMIFFSDPAAIFEEIGRRSIAITPHRFTPQNKGQFSANGHFNVSWVFIRNNPIGNACVERWANQCREWCFYRHEAGKFGDQKYLDEWPKLYKEELCEIENPGAGLAPWNLQNYTITEGPRVDGQPVIFYHAHEFDELGDGSFRLTHHPLRMSDRTFIYQPYVGMYRLMRKAVDEARQGIQQPAAVRHR